LQETSISESLAIEASHLTALLLAPPYTSAALERPPNEPVLVLDEQSVKYIVEKSG
jgi:hypothetical protein